MEVITRRMDMDIMSREVEQMFRMNLRSHNQCKEIIRMRNQFEWKICEITKKQKDFEDYIEYEMTLLETLRSRGNALKIVEKIGDIEHKILNRIKYLYDTAIKVFPSNLKLCLAYYVFCKWANFVNAASVAVSNMIKNHSHNEEVFQVAAQWHAFDRKDISTALNVIRNGLVKHKTSKLLYTEVIELEIQNTVGKKDQGIPEDVLKQTCLENLQTYIREISNNIDDCEYYVELLESLEEYEFTKEVQNTIIECLVKNHLSKAVTWNMLAQRDKKGLSMPINAQTSAFSTNMKIDYVSRYKQGLNQVSMLEKEILWSLYINSLIEEKQDEVNTNLKEAFEQASAEGYLSEKYYVQWLALVDDHEKAAIVEKGVAKFPESIELWEIYLRLEILAHDKKCTYLTPDNPHSIKILSDSKNHLEKVFKEGVKALNEKSLPLWIGMIRYHMLSFNNDKIEAIYVAGIKEPTEISDVLKPQYIEWLSILKGPDYTRKQYFAIANEEPYCKDLHITMLKLESAEMEIDFDVGDKVHKLACEQFGANDDEVWLNRVRYYIDYMRANSTVSKEQDIQHAYADAKTFLSHDLFVNFNHKYNSMMSLLEPSVSDNVT